MKIAFAMLALLAACTSGSAPPSTTYPKPCNDDPFECPSGKTCWLKDGLTYDCLVSGPSKLGQSCDAEIGTAHCGDGLYCQASMAGMPGTCVAYCDAAHPCATGTTCMTAHAVMVPGSFTVCQ